MTGRVPHYLVVAGLAQHVNRCHECAWQPFINPSHQITIMISVRCHLAALAWPFGLQTLYKFWTMTFNLNLLPYSKLTLYLSICSFLKRQRIPRALFIEHSSWVDYWEHTITAGKTKIHTQFLMCLILCILYAMYEVCLSAIVYTSPYQSTVSTCMSSVFCDGICWISKIACSLTNQTCGIWDSLFPL